MVFYAYVLVSKKTGKFVVGKEIKNGRTTTKLSLTEWITCNTEKEAIELLNQEYNPRAYEVKQIKITTKVM